MFSCVNVDRAQVELLGKVSKGPFNEVRRDNLILLKLCGSTEVKEVTVDDVCGFVYSWTINGKKLYSLRFPLLRVPFFVRDRWVLV